MTAPAMIDPARLLGQAVGDASPDLMRHLLGTVINALLSAEADAVCGAEYGVADPARGEGAPQREAEIMAGRYVNASGQLVMPDSLAACLIGAKTAREINLDAVFQRRYGGT